jgi:hypothetical protein
MRDVWRWVRAKKALVISCGILLLCVATWAWYGWWSSFEPDYYYRADVSNIAVEKVYDMAKGQVFKLRIEAVRTDDYRRDYVVVIRQATKSSSSSWVAGYILKDCPDVAEGDLVRFKAPYSGSYQVSIKSRSGDWVPIEVYYSISG